MFNKPNLLFYSFVQSQANHVLTLSEVVIFSFHFICEKKENTVKSLF